MSYHEQGIQALSQSQIGKLLNGHSVRVKQGIEQAIHLCEEHCKKLIRASLKGKGITIRLDPFAIHHNQHLKNAVRQAVRRTQVGGKVGTDLGKHLAGNVGQLADAGTGYLVRQMGGKVGRPRKMRGGDGRGMGEARRQETEREKYLARGPPMAGVGIHGGKLSNKLKHAQQVMDFLGHNYQGIAHAVRPVSKPVIGALTSRAVNYINPMGQIDSVGESLKHLFGGAVKKNRGRPRKSGGNITPAGSQFTPY